MTSMGTFDHSIPSHDSFKAIGFHTDIGRGGGNIITNESPDTSRHTIAALIDSADFV